MRALVLGLDGTNVRLIRPWVEQGELPGFAALMKEGAWCDLESVPNQRSAAAWTSFMTGKNPGKHGIYEFYEVPAGRYRTRFIHGGMRTGATLWGLVSAAGRKVGVINVPMTYPAESVNGFLIAGLDAPGVDSKGFTRPAGLYRELVDAVGGYVIEPGLTGCIVAGDVDAAVSRLHEELDQKIAATRYLMHKYPWDLLVTVFRSTDAAHHCFWKYMDRQHPDFRPEEAQRYGDVILSAYRKVDTFLQEILALLEDDTVLFVMSDHGCGRKHPASNQLNSWLEYKGYLQFGRGSLRGGPRLTRLLGDAYRLIIGQTPRKIKENLWRWFPHLRDQVQSRLCFSGIDWTRTRAYSDTLFPVVWVNLRGREPMGIVEPGSEYRAILEDLKKDLLQIRDVRTAQEIVDQVFFREEIYSGPFVEKAPDLLVRWREDIPISGVRMEGRASREPFAGATLIPGEDHRVISGDHTLQGILMAWGKPVRRSPNQFKAKIVDLAPTILYALSVPVPADMDGSELLWMFEDEFVRTHPGSRQTRDVPGPTEPGGEYSAEDEETIRERLRGLGYLE